MDEIKPDDDHIDVLKKYFGHSMFRPCVDQFSSALNLC